MTYKIPLFDLNFDEAEEEAVLAVLRSKWISMGPKTAELEQRFADELGVRQAVAVNSGTAALHLALAALGVGEGDEVIVPSMTFVATVNAVRYVGATPIFADITSLDDFSIDPEYVRAQIGPRTRAILPMHYGGFACDMRALGAIVQEHKLLLIEDAAHAPATWYEGRRVGTLGDAGCFSFFSNKNMTCAEGGMLVTNREDVAQRARLMRSHGMTTLSYERSRGHATYYDVVSAGWNYRLDDIRAALALMQMEKLLPDASRRQELREYYVESLRGTDGVRIPYLAHSYSASNYIFPILVAEGGPERRDAIRNELARRGIQTSVHYPAVHRFSAYRRPERSLPKTEFIADQEITLPLFGTLTEHQVDYIARCLAECLPSCAARSQAPL